MMPPLWLIGAASAALIVSHSAAHVTGRMVGAANERVAIERKATAERVRQSEESEKAQTAAFNRTIAREAEIEALQKKVDDYEANGCPVPDADARWLSDIR